MIKHYSSVKEIFKCKKNDIQKGLDRYNSIMSALKKINVAYNMDFQKNYRYFYKVYRRTNQFCNNYFEYFESIKNNINIDFQTILQTICLFRENNELEMSFSSKILHTINPNYPIWDSIVTKEHFKIYAPSRNLPNQIRIVEASKTYDDYKDKFYEYMKSVEGKEIIELFDENFPNNTISNVKKIDFVLWQDRKQKNR